MLINLTQLKPGKTGIVRDILGSFGLVSRLQSMGIRPGKKITKLSAQAFRGPQTVKIDNLQIALGFKMTRRILVEVEK